MGEANIKIAPRHNARRLATFVAEIPARHYLSSWRAFSCAVEWVTMVETEKAPTRRKPRFSLRILLILMTIACLYLGCWFPTATSGVRDINDRYSKPSRPMAPLFLVTDIYETRMENGA